jgi:hypothetical protein
MRFRLIQVSLYLQTYKSSRTSRALFTLLGIKILKKNLFLLHESFKFKKHRKVSGWNQGDNTLMRIWLHTIWISPESMFTKRKSSLTSQHRRSEDHKFYNISVYPCRESIKSILFRCWNEYSASWLALMRCGWKSILLLIYSRAQVLQSFVSAIVAVLPWHPLASSNITAGFVSPIYCS